MCKIDFDKIAVEHRRRLHERAEVGFALSQTTKYITENLANAGYITKLIGKGSILATEVGEHEEYVLLRADMDALPMMEETNLPFSSNNGRMHACGHDMHAAMLLSAAEALAYNKARKRHGVILLFQAAEESLQGASDVLESGELDKYNIIFAVTVHVLLGLPYNAGTLVLPPEGTVAPGADVLNIEIKGKSSHGSTPHLGKSSIYPAIDIIEQTNRMLSLEFSPMQIRHINWGYFHGGNEANIVAEKTELRANFRYFEQQVRDKAINRIKEITKSAAVIGGCNSKLEIVGGCPPLINSKHLLSRIESIIEKEGLDYIKAKELQSTGIAKSLGGSEDFAHFSNKYDSALISICAGNKETGHLATLHTSKTDFHEDALKCGWRFFYSMAVHL